jgi:hypothetical protein
MSNPDLADSLTEEIDSLPHGQRLLEFILLIAFNVFLEPLQQGPLRL